MFYNLLYKDMLLVFTNNYLENSKGLRGKKCYKGCNMSTNISSRYMSTNRCIKLNRYDISHVTRKLDVACDQATDLYLWLG